MKQTNFKYRTINIVAIVVLISAVIALNLVMIRDGLNGKTDMKWHLTWLQHFYHQITEGILYPRWLAGTNYGYGSPTFVFYPPLVYYLGSFSKFVGFSTQNAVTFLFSLALFLSGFNFYLFGCNRWGKIPSLFGSLAYMSMPYLALDIYWRGALSSIFVQAWIPLVWYFTDKCFEKSQQQKWKLLLAFSWTIVALTHVPSLLVCFISWHLYILYYLCKGWWRKTLQTILLCYAGLGIASFYLIPAVFEQPFVNTSVMKGVLGGFKEGMMGVGLSFFDVNLNNLVSIPYLFWHHSIAIFSLSILIFLKYKNKAIFNECLLWTLLSLFIVFMMTPPSIPLWQSSSTIQMLQFPWRFLQIYAFFGAAIFTLAINILNQSKSILKLALIAILAFILLFNGRYYYRISRQFVTINNPNPDKIQHLQYIKTIINNPYQDNLRDVEEYRAITEAGTPPIPVIGQNKLSVLEGDATFEIEKWQSYNRLFNITVQTPSTMRVRTYYYPGWHLYVNQKYHQINKYKDGTILFNLEPGSYNVQLNYQMTKHYLIGIALSIFSIVSLAILVYLIQKKYLFF